MCDDSPPTKDNIFGTSSESELEQGEDRDVSGSAVASSKKRAAPNGSHRARLTVAEKTEAMKHYQAKTEAMKHYQNLKGYSLGGS